jgi:hypothetical protein
VRKLVDDIGLLPDPPVVTAFILGHAGVWLLDAHDGLPGQLFLTDTQFEELQQYWSRNDLPGDLFYPARERRWEIEPVQPAPMAAPPGAS